MLSSHHPHSLSATLATSSILYTSKSYFSPSKTCIALPLCISVNSWPFKKNNWPSHSNTFSRDCTWQGFYFVCNYVFCISLSCKYCFAFFLIWVYMESAHMLLPQDFHITTLQSQRLSFYHCTKVTGVDSVWCHFPRLSWRLCAWSCGAIKALSQLSLHICPKQPCDHGMKKEGPKKVFIHNSNNTITVLCKQKCYN